MGTLTVRDDETERTLYTGWESDLVLERDGTGVPRVVVSSDAPFDPNDVPVQEASDDALGPEQTDWPWALLVVPTVLAILLGALTAGGVLSLAGLDTPLAFTAAALTYLGAVFGTLLILNDAAYLKNADAAWQPNPWLFVGGGGVALVGISTLLAPSLSMTALVGVLITAVAASSVVSGPVYLLLRDRYAGLP
ncbi:hypothetical protein [Halolamina sp.]|jgi:uncharacterized membrane protein YdcZ (DUF606 family)|uniref:hypothetical protein n=1 Tax=Halolamina sp. TaxID=1940283 RepID=UPI000223BC07|nr:hypothetical protein Halar_3699 [halophilic archaeon DL31]